MPVPFAEFIEVSKTYRLDDVEIQPVSGLNFTINSGDFMTISGPSGSGKSTFLNLLGCIDKPTAGRITIDGDVVTDRSIEELSELRMQKIGFIFQAFNLVPVLSAYENVELPLLFAKHGFVSLQERVEHLLERVGLADRMHQLPAKLSGGQRQRVAIARALVANPTLIIADEPTANLDRKTAEGIIDLLLTLNAEQGVTVVIATHDTHITARAPIQVKMEDGQLYSS